ncbi:hypothetical protein BFP71_02420 [Roseivirga misakiensis]|uniref:DUF3299 domain-containing protein n=1 Tax=Roseivirga misakiensis TaxID=1563681 RepID=A0A1E5T588_9BACT|nr:hypothetical protein BFP71_02420 [Roseivirga misakiensis]
MLRSVILFCFLSFAVPLDQSSKPNAWKTLAKVKIEKRFDETLNYEIDYPTFSKEVKALNGKEISLDGWMIPLDELRGKNYFVLSALPFANCFFCGGAGPETVVEVFLKKDLNFTEKRIKVKGKLSVNGDDPLKLMYILEEAEIMD